MSAENPTPKNMPRKRLSQSAKYAEVLDEQGYLKDPKTHAELIRQITCGCESHENAAYTTIFRAGIPTPKGIVDIYLRYAEDNHKVHRAYLEQENKKVWQLASEILKNNK